MRERAKRGGALAFPDLPLLFYVQACVSPGPPGTGTLGAGVRDAALLRAEVVRTLVEGAYFRLSAVVLSPSKDPEPISR